MEGQAEQAITDKMHESCPQAGLALPQKFQKLHSPLEFRVLMGRQTEQKRVSFSFDVKLIVLVSK